MDLGLCDGIEKEFCDYFGTHIKACVMCNGFYSLNFDQPVCSTCHMFLFPSICDEYDETVIEKADSCDSGNDEPIAELDAFLEKTDQKPISQSIKIISNDKLEERIKELSVPRDLNSKVLPRGLVDSLPTEVLVCVFSYLNDIALCNARNVCLRWRQILDSELSDEKWKDFTNQRWPLFKPTHNVSSWKALYSKLFDSISCLYCFENENIAFFAENSWRYTRLHNEVRNFCADPLDGIQALPLDPCYFNWHACISGPRGSPYDGGLFFLSLQVPPSYPMKPPAVHFITKIFHPNISRHGDIGLDSIDHNWSLALTIAKVLISIQSLLTDPYSYVCMEPEIGKLYQENRKLFEEIARLWTLKFAVHDERMGRE